MIEYRTAYNVISVIPDLALNVIAMPIRNFRNTSIDKFGFCSRYISEDAIEMLDPISKLYKSLFKKTALSIPGILSGIGTALLFISLCCILLVDKLLGTAFGAVEGAYKSIKKFIAHEICTFRDVGKIVVGAEVRKFERTPIDLLSLENALGAGNLLEFPRDVLNEVYPTPILNKALYRGRRAVIDQISSYFID